MTRERRSWAMFAAMLPLVVVNVMNVARQRVDWTQAWPLWRPMILDLTLLVAGAVLVAGVAFGVHAWRRGADA